MTGYDDLETTISWELSNGNLAYVIDRLDSGELTLDDSLGSDGITLMHLAAKTGHMILARELLNRGAFADPADEWGVTPFHLACREGDQQMAKLLAKHGADIDGQDPQGRTGIYRAIEERKNDMIPFLKELGVDHTIETHAGESPMDLANAVGEPAIFEALRQYYPPQRLYYDDELSKDELMREGAQGQKALDAGITWLRWADVSETLEQRGESLSKEELMKPSQHGLSYLEFAVRFDAGGAVIQHMNAHGDVLTPEDLLNDDGTPNPLLEKLTDKRQLAPLFQIDNWKEQNGQDLQKVYDALSEKARKQVGNMHQLKHQMSRHEQQESRSSGERLR